MFVRRMRTAFIIYLFIGVADLLLICLLYVILLFYAIKQILMYL